MSQARLKKNHLVDAEGKKICRVTSPRLQRALVLTGVDIEQLAAVDRSKFVEPGLQGMVVDRRFEAAVARQQYHATLVMEKRLMFVEQATEAAKAAKEAGLDSPEIPDEHAQLREQKAKLAELLAKEKERFAARVKAMKREQDDALAREREQLKRMKKIKALEKEKERKSMEVRVGLEKERLDRERKMEEEERFVMAKQHSQQEEREMRDARRERERQQRAEDMRDLSTRFNREHLEKHSRWQREMRSSARRAEECKAADWARVQQNDQVLSARSSRHRNEQLKKYKQQSKEFEKHLEDVADRRQRRLEEAGRKQIEKERAALERKQQEDRQREATELRKKKDAAARRDKIKKAQCYSSDQAKEKEQIGMERLAHKQAKIAEAANAKAESLMARAEDSKIQRDMKMDRIKRMARVEDYARETRLSEIKQREGKMQKVAQAKKRIKAKQAQQVKQMSVELERLRHEMKKM